MQITWTEPAISDLTNIRTYIGQDNKEIARNVAARIRDAASQLRDFPESGREGDDPQTREVVVKQLPYILEHFKID